MKVYAQEHHPDLGLIDDDRTEDLREKRMAPVAAGAIRRNDPPPARKQGVLT